MKKTSHPPVSRFVGAALALAGLVDLAGFAFSLFYWGIFCDNLAHFVTPFALVALAAELYARYGSEEFPRTGAGRLWREQSRVSSGG